MCLPLWQAIEEGIAAARFVAAEEVRVEIATKDELIDTRTGRSGVDPFVIVIASARTRGAVVVTGAKDDGTTDRPRLPTVGRHFGIRAIRPLDFIRENRWVFSHRGA